jgi:TolB-like protein
MDMLASRISANEKITVIGKEKILDMMKTVKSKDLSLTEASSLGKRLNADYAVCGSITKTGNSVIIDGKLVNIAVNKSPIGTFTESLGMDDVITKINDFAQKINQFIMGEPQVDVATASGIVVKGSVLSQQAPQTPVSGSR